MNSAMQSIVSTVAPTPMESMRGSTRSLVSRNNSSYYCDCFSTFFKRINQSRLAIGGLTWPRLGEKYYAPLILGNKMRVSLYN